LENCDILRLPSIRKNSNDQNPKQLLNKIILSWKSFSIEGEQSFKTSEKFEASRTKRKWKYYLLYDRLLTPGLRPFNPGYNGYNPGYKPVDLQSILFKASIKKPSAKGKRKEFDTIIEQIRESKESVASTLKKTG
jgi:hypothetical protein